MTQSFEIFIHFFVHAYLRKRGRKGEAGMGWEGRDDGKGQKEREKEGGEGEGNEEKKSGREFWGWGKRKGGCQSIKGKKTSEKGGDCRVCKRSRKLRRGLDG